MEVTVLKFSKLSLEIDGENLLHFDVNLSLLPTEKDYSLYFTRLATSLFPKSPQHCEKSICRTQAKKGACWWVSGSRLVASLVCHFSIM